MRVRAILAGAIAVLALCSMGMGSASSNGQTGGQAAPAAAVHK